MRSNVVKPYPTISDTLPYLITSLTNESDPAALKSLKDKKEMDGKNFALNLLSKLQPEIWSLIKLFKKRKLIKESALSDKTQQSQFFIDAIPNPALPPAFMFAGIRLNHYLKKILLTLQYIKNLTLPLH